MIFFYEFICYSILVTEQIVNPIIAFAGNFKIMKNESK